MPTYTLILTTLPAHTHMHTHKREEQPFEKADRVEWIPQNHAISLLYPEKTKTNKLEHCFSNFNVHMNNLRILLKCRFWLGGAWVLRGAWDSACQCHWSLNHTSIARAYRILCPQHVLYYNRGGKVPWSSNIENWSINKLKQVVLWEDFSEMFNLLNFKKI